LDSFFSPDSFFFEPVLPVICELFNLLSNINLEVNIY
jgi:hypothetical protein